MCSCSPEQPWLADLCSGGAKAARGSGWRPSKEGRVQDLRFHSYLDRHKLIALQRALPLAIGSAFVLGDVALAEVSPLWSPRLSV